MTGIIDCFAANLTTTNITSGGGTLNWVAAVSLAALATENNSSRCKMEDFSLAPIPFACFCQKKEKTNSG